MKALTQDKSIEELRRELATTTGSTPARSGGATRRRARARPQRDRMNRLESRFAREVLDVRLAAGEIDRWEFEPLRLRLGGDWKTTYSPDFLVQRTDGELEFVEVKGFWEEDARAKTKIAARLFAWAHVVAWTWDKAARRWAEERF